MEEVSKFLSAKNAFRIFVFLVLLNLLFLDFLLVNNRKVQIIERTISVPNTIDICPKSCLSEISQATKGAILSVKPSVVLTPLPTAKPVSQTSASSSVKEFFVPFGTGSNSSDDWQDVPGLKATLDSVNYNNIKTVAFEATIRIPTGNETAYVRLYNVNDKHPVWFSEISLEGGTPQLIISKPITLDSGNKTYQVQMKTSLKYPAYLDQSRLHIITN